MNPIKAYGLQIKAGQHIEESRAEYLRQCRRDNRLAAVAVGGALVMVGLSILMAILGI